MIVMQLDLTIANGNEPRERHGFLVGAVVSDVGFLISSGENVRGRQTRGYTSGSRGVTKGSASINPFSGSMERPGYTLRRAVLPLGIQSHWARTVLVVYDMTEITPQPPIGTLPITARALL